MNIFKKELLDNNLPELIIEQRDIIHHNYYEANNKKEKLKSLMNMGVLSWALILVLASSFFKYWLILSIPVAIIGRLSFLSMNKKIEKQEKEAEKMLKSLEVLINEPENQYKLIHLVKSEEHIFGVDKINNDIYELKMLFLSIRQYGLNKNYLDKLGTIMRLFKHKNFNPKQDLENLTAQYEQYVIQQKESGNKLKEML